MMVAPALEHVVGRGVCVVVVGVVHPHLPPARLPLPGAAVAVGVAVGLNHPGGRLARVVDFFCINSNR
jgi:hypothetical protein